MNIEKPVPDFTAEEYRRVLLTPKIADRPKTVSDYAPEYLQHINFNVAPRTAAIYMDLVNRLILPHVGHLEPSAVTITHYRTFMDNLRKREYTGKYMVEVVKFMKRMFDWFEDNKIITANPYHRRQLPRVIVKRADKVPFTYAEYERARAVSRQANRYRWFLESALALGWHTGLRMSDVALLPWSAVDFEAEKLTVYPKKKESTREKLVIPIEPELYDHLQHLYKTKRIENNDFVLPEMKANYLTHVGNAKLSQWFRSIFNEAELPDHTFHSFRHGFVTRLLNAGTDVITIGSMTGQSITQIRTYAHVSSQAKSNALTASRNSLHRSALTSQGVIAPQPTDLKS